MKTTGRLLLDTNIISDLNDNVPETLEVLASAEEIFTSVIAAVSFSVALRTPQEGKRISVSILTFFRPALCLTSRWILPQFTAPSKQISGKKASPSPRTISGWLQLPFKMS